MTGRGATLSGYVEDGLRKRLTRSASTALLAKARKDGTAYDATFNSNGVRRYAAVALRDDGNDDGRMFGVLALAEGYHFNRKDRSKDLLLQLANTIETL
jgi:DNA-binding IclR family transcriptional regulator